MSIQPERWWRRQQIKYPQSYIKWKRNDTVLGKTYWDSQKNYERFFYNDNKR